MGRLRRAGRRTSSNECDGQILVVNDLIGLTDFPPRFAEPVAMVGDDLLRAGRQWVKNVCDRSIGGKRYSMRVGESEKLGRGTENDPGRVSNQS